MEAIEFLEIARSKISNDPRSRLSKPAKSVIDHPECVIDIHAHIFDKKCLNIGFVLLRLLKSKISGSFGLESLSADSFMMKNEEEIYSDVISMRQDSETDWAKLENEIENVVEISDTAEIFGLTLKEALRVLKKKSMLGVLDYYIDNFSIVRLPEFTNSPFLTGVLMMDLETGWGIRPKKKLSRQVSEIRQILSRRAVIPFLPIDPRRAGLKNSDENLYDLFLNAFSHPQTPFFGVKCYPALGYLPDDMRLDPVFQICAEKNIPVLTHCGGEIISTSEKSFEYYHSGGIREFKIPGNSRTDRAKYLNEPELWTPVLEKYNNLKLCFGHFGGDASWGNHQQSGGDLRINKIIELMKNPDYKVFADFSYNVAEKELYDTFKKELNNNPDLRKKIMFGTDYWVVLPEGNLLEKQGSFLAQMKDHQKTLLQTAPLNFLLS